MIFNQSVLLPVAASLALTQVCQALPQATKVAPRDDAEPAAPTKPAQLFDIYGDAGHPTIADLEDASILGYQEENTIKGFDKALVTLLGFMNSDPRWIESWFPNAEETARYAQHTLAPGEAYVLPYIAVLDARVLKPAKLKDLGVVSYILKGFNDHFTSKSKPWWPWALLHGALEVKYDPQDESLKLDEITLALSAHELVHRNVEDEAKLGETELWDIVSQRENTAKSPVWIETKDKYFNAMAAYEEDGLIESALFEDGKVKHENLTIEAVMKDLVEVTHLLALPPFKEGERYGKWLASELSPLGESGTGTQGPEATPLTSSSLSSSSSSSTK